MTRTYGTGTMSELRPGLWRFRVSVKDPISGKPSQRSKTIRTKTRPSKKELDAQLAAFQQELYVKRSTGKKATVGKLLDDWLADLESEGRARSTLETYRSHVEHRIRPKLGTVPLEDMDVDRVRAFVRSLDGTPSYQRLTHAILRGALSFAVANDWITVNPATRVKPPRRPEDHTDALTPDQVAELYQAADPTLAMAILLASITGCRRGELCGLQWADVDWKAQTLRIERAFVPGQGGQRLGPTKSRDRRTLSMKGDGIKVLKRWHAKQTATYGDLGPWLMSDSDGTEPLRAKNVTAAFSRLARAAGIDAHFHDLRHFAQTQLIGAGVDIKTVAGRGGHTPQVLLETYTHGLADRDAAAAVTIGRILTKAIEGPRKPKTPARKQGSAAKPLGEPSAIEEPQ